MFRGSAVMSMTKIVDLAGLLRLYKVSQRGKMPRQLYLVPKASNTKFSGYIPIQELQITYSKSSAPGGQNVNKVNTKVDVRFHVKSASWLTEDIKQKLLETHKTKITKEGYFVLRSEKTRLQQLNVADVLETLRGIIRAAAEPPAEVAPETHAKLRRRAEKNARIRLMEKRAHSEIKQQRQAPEVNF